MVRKDSLDGPFSNAGALMDGSFINHDSIERNTLNASFEGSHLGGPMDGVEGLTLDDLRSEQAMTRFEGNGPGNYGPLSAEEIENRKLTAAVIELKDEKREKERRLAEIDI